MKNILNSMQKPSFDDFRKKRIFQDFSPRIYGAWIQLIHSVEESTKRVLAGWIRQITTTGKLWKDGIEKIDTIVTPFDLPKFDWLDKNWHLVELDSKENISLWMKSFFEIDIEDSSFVERMNFLLDRWLYDYNWTYHWNLPNTLRNYKFDSKDDIYNFIRTGNNPRTKYSSIFLQVLKCMLWASIIRNTPKLAQSWKFHKIFTRDHIEPNFSIWEDKTWILSIDWWKQNPINIAFKILDRDKSDESKIKKLLALPKTSEDEIWNDLWWFEFEVSNKHEVILLLNYILENIIIKNYNTKAPNSKTSDYQTLLSILKNHWWFDIRQKNMLLKKDIEDFFREFPNIHLHQLLRHMLENDEIRDESKPMTGSNFKDIKFQWNFNFWSDLWESSIEIRIVLKDNENNDRFEHELIRDWERILRGKSRLSSGWFSPEYLDRIARIISSEIPHNPKTNLTNPQSTEEIVWHYRNKTEDLKNGLGKSIDRLITFKWENDRKAKNGILITKYK